MRYYWKLFKRKITNVFKRNKPSTRNNKQEASDDVVTDVIMDDLHQARFKRVALIVGSTLR